MVLEQDTFHRISMKGGTPQWMVYKFYKGKIPLKWMMTRGTPILGNPTSGKTYETISRFLVQFGGTRKSRKQYFRAPDVIVT